MTVRKCSEIIDLHPGRLGRYIGGGQRQCRNKATVETMRGVMCKRHARQVLPNKSITGIGGQPMTTNNTTTVRRADGPVRCELLHCPCGSTDFFRWYEATGLYVENITVTDGLVEVLECNTDAVRRGKRSQNITCRQCGAEMSHPGTPKNA